MKITSLKTYLLQHQLPRTIGLATFFYTSRSSLLIKLETDDGLVGWGETAPFADMRGKTLNLSVAELYGGRLHEQVPTYASTMNYTQGLDSVLK